MITFRDVYPNFNIYQTVQAREALEFQKENHYYSPAFYCTYDLLITQQYEPDNVKQAREEWLETLARLQEYIDGSATSPIYLFQYRNLYELNEEWPKWRPLPPHYTG